MREASLMLFTEALSGRSRRQLHDRVHAALPFSNDERMRVRIPLLHAAADDLQPQSRPVQVMAPVALKSIRRNPRAGVRYVDDDPSISLRALDPDADLQRQRA